MLVPVLGQIKQGRPAGDQSGVDAQLGRPRVTMLLQLQNPPFGGIVHATNHMAEGSRLLLGVNSQPLLGQLWAKPWRRRSESLVRAPAVQPCLSEAVTAAQIKIQCFRGMRRTK